MSGICGIVNLDGAPVDRQLIQKLTAFMSFRGPDAQNVWIEGQAGFGHTLLRTTVEMAHERQPLTIDGKVWITADARIDGREELKKKLAENHCTGLPSATDAELILHAYHAWGEDCLKHLIGDFAFAIWDAPRKRLFCARDHFGVKLFFFARVGMCLIFSNTLNCVRQHPAISDTLNELAIADFLLFDSNQDPATTAFADIQRLPPAQYLTFSAAGLELKNYWTLPTDAAVRYRRAGDYVDHFTELFDLAVADRLRTDRVAVEMSGGLDSTAIAATALGILSRQSNCFNLTAHSVVYDRLIPHDERMYSGIVATKLGIPIHYCVADNYKLYEGFDLPAMHLAEPSHEPNLAINFDGFTAAAAQSRVVLTGLDGDALMTESPKPYFRYLLRNGQLGRLLTGMVRYGVSQRRLVPLSLLGWLRRGKGGTGPATPQYPAWLNPDFERQLDLRGRWDRVTSTKTVPHPIRPYAYKVFGNIMRLSNFFDAFDAGFSRLPLEYRHPLMDLRLLTYCLSLPPLPWCVKKEIFRTAMRDKLPDSIRRRPKTPLSGHPHVELLRHEDSRWVDHFIATPEINAYIDRGKIPLVCGNKNPIETWMNLRPLSLDFWFRRLQSADH